MKARILNNKFQGVYTNIFIIDNWDKVINGQLVSEWQLTEVLPSENLLKPTWNGSEWIEGETPEEIAEQQTKALKQKETDLYIKRMQDAQRIWAELSAEFRIAKQIGQMDDATENIILAELKPILDIVVPFGQWKTGYQLLLGVGSSVIGQALYDKLHDIIWNYIQENYEEMEVSQLKQSLNQDNLWKKD
jgi:hypothetical protein